MVVLPPDELLELDELLLDEELLDEELLEELLLEEELLLLDEELELLEEPPGSAPPHAAREPASMAENSILYLLISVAPVIAF